MQYLFSQLKTMGEYKEILKESCKQNGIKISFILSMTLNKAKQVHKKISHSRQQQVLASRVKWCENQIKLFQFCLLVLSAIEKQKIKNFKESQWEKIASYFPNKSLHLLQFQSQSFIIEKSIVHRKWEVREDKLLDSVIRGRGKPLKWNEIAIELYMRSERNYFRLGKQCRERWLNHLDDRINHEKWSEEEDRKLVRSALESGKKWSLIMKKLENRRTEHMIKNRFTSLVVRYKKRFPFVFGEDEALRGIAQEMEIYHSDNQMLLSKESTRVKIEDHRHEENSLSSIEEQIKEEGQGRNQSGGEGAELQIGSEKRQNCNVLSFSPSESLMSPNNPIYFTYTIVPPISIFQNFNGNFFNYFPHLASEKK